MKNVAGMETEMIKCWCGNKDLKEYSADYYKCDKCHTLISKHNFQDTIYDVKLNSHPSFPFCKRVSHFESDLQILYPTFHFCNDFPVFSLAFMI